MAVYGHIYRTYEGELTDPRRRFLVLARYAVADLFSSRLFLAAFLLCLVPILVGLVRLYLGHNLEFMTTFGIDPAPFKKLLAVDAKFFRTWILIPQAALAFLLASRAAPTILSRDLTNNGLPLFLARPISRWEYIGGKATALVFVLGCVTLVPPLVLFLFQCAFEGMEWISKYYWVAFSLITASLLWAVMLTLVGLAMTALAKRAMMAQLLFFATPFFLSGLGLTINANFDTHYGQLIQTPWLLWVMWNGLLRVDPVVKQISPASAWLVFAAVAVLCLLVLARQIRAYEVER